MVLRKSVARKHVVLNSLDEPDCTPELWQVLLLAVASSLASGPQRLLIATYYS